MVNHHDGATHSQITAVVLAGIGDPVLGQGSASTTRFSSATFCQLAQKVFNVSHVSLCWGFPVTTFKPHVQPERQLVKATYLSHHAIVVVVVIIRGVDVI